MGLPFRSKISLKRNDYIKVSYIRAVRVEINVNVMALSREQRQGKTYSVVQPSA